MSIRSITGSALKALSLSGALSIAVALAGCGNNTPASKAVGDTDRTPAATSQPDSLGLDNSMSSGRTPCEYMARADAEAAVGQALPGTTEHAALGMCDYVTPEFYGASLTVGDWESMRNAAASGAQQPTAIAGVGDEALNLNGSNGSNLYVRKGDRGFLLTLNGPHIDGLPDHGLEREKVLALKILASL